MSKVMPRQLSLFPGYGDPNVPLSPVAVGELPPSVCQAAFDSFDRVQFDVSRCNPPCQLSDLDPRLIEVGNKIYEKVPFKVNCAYRSVAWDKARGRDGKSSHCKGLALDIEAIDHRLRLQLVAAIVQAGVKRIGIAKRFIHFDVDPDKMPSMWLYYPENLNKTF